MKVVLLHCLAVSLLLPQAIIAQQQVQTTAQQQAQTTAQQQAQATAQQQAQTTAQQQAQTTAQQHAQTTAQQQTQSTAQQQTQTAAQQQTQTAAQQQAQTTAQQQAQTTAQQQATMAQQQQGCIGPIQVFCSATRTMVDLCTTPCSSFQHLLIGPGTFERQGAASSCLILTPAACEVNLNGNSVLTASGVLNLPKYCAINCAGYVKTSTGQFTSGGTGQNFGAVSNPQIANPNAKGVPQGGMYWANLLLGGGANQKQNKQPGGRRLRGT